MARTVQVHLTDDLDGSAADSTVTFALDGQGYEIDLSVDNATRFRSALRTYIDAGRRTGRGLTVGAARAGGRRPGSPKASDRAQNKAIREWAKSKKIKLSDRGRIPADVVARYEKEAGRR
jgi:hypothetical protein